MTSTRHTFLKLICVLLGLIPRLGFSQSPEPAVGVWNGYLGHTNVLECINLSSAPVSLGYEVKAGDGSLVGTGLIALGAFGTEHVVLNQFPIADRYGILSVGASQPQIDGFYCVVMIYQLAAAAPPRYAVAIPVKTPAAGIAAGIFNTASPDGLGVVHNWLTIANPGTSPLTGVLEVFDLAGSAAGAPINVEVGPGSRLDLPLGGAAVSLGLYRFLPSSSQQKYRAVLSRYGEFLPGDFRFAFSAGPEPPACEKVLPASTMDPALNWLEVGNPGQQPLTLRIGIFAADGSLVHERQEELSPRSQRHLLVNEHLEPKSIGSVRLSCLNGVSPGQGFVAQSVFYGYSPDFLSLRWVYASQGEVRAAENSMLGLPINTHLGAANWVKLLGTGARSQAVLRISSGGGQPMIADFPELGGAQALDIALHQTVSPESVASTTIELAASEGMISGELLRVFTHSDGTLATVAAVPAAVTASVPNAGGEFSDRSGPAVISGELRRWHRVTLTFEGPIAAEDGEPNPFTDYRLDVVFSNEGRAVSVPGHFAADGRSAESGESAGSKWRVHFMPDAVGTWNYQASFRSGQGVATADDPLAGQSSGFDGAAGSFVVAETDKASPDFRALGRLDHVGHRYLQFQQAGQYYLKLGTNSPENFLAYQGFDATVASHHFYPHLGDWGYGDPSWKGGAGRGIIGAVNYLASAGVNAIYFLTMNTMGDGNDVWPWKSPDDPSRFDVSKLDQWEILFAHMTRKGVMPHIVTQETENDQLLDGGGLGPQRKLYYRELIARFSHHPALIWNVGEENSNTTEEQKSIAEFLKSTDPYDHPVVLHTFPDDKEKVYAPLLGNQFFDGISLQIASGETIEEWIGRSATAGRQWVVAYDEQGPAEFGIPPDSESPTQDFARTEVLWPTLMSGGMGVEYYFGYQFSHDDLNLEDFRSRDTLWRQGQAALAFFRSTLPFSAMEPCPGTFACLTDGGNLIALYVKSAAPEFDFGGSPLMYSVEWFNPRTGGPLQAGTIGLVGGPGVVPLGEPPDDTGPDWVIVLRAAN